LLRPPQAAAPATPFDALLVQLVGTAAPGGNELPVTGNDLPAATDDLPEADALAASELVALVASPPPTAAPVAAPVSATVLAADAAAPADSVPPAATAPPDQAAVLRQVGLAFERVLSSPSALPDAGNPVGVATDELAEIPAPDTAAPVTTVDVAPAVAEAALPPLPPAASASDRIVATLVAARSPPTVEVTLANAAPVARAVNEMRPSAERRTANVPAATPGDGPRATAAPLAQLLDLAATPIQGDGHAAAPQPIHTADALPLVATPSATAAAAPDTQPIAPAHSASVNVPNAATALDGTSQTASSPTPSQGAPLDTAARWHDALASRVQWLVDHDVGEARIKLNPPELGALDVKISLHDDKTFVQLTAHNAAARDELAQSLPRLRELLAANGLELGGATVSGGRDGGAGRYPGAEPAARALDFAAPADPEPVRALSAASSRIDVFA
jgi:flagellar hook-length control protein FliK